MEIPTADPVLYQGFRNIVNAGRSPPVSPRQQSISPQAVLVDSKLLLPQSEHDHPLKDQADMGSAMSSSATEPSARTNLEPAPIADNQVVERSNHLVRPKTHNKSPSIEFRYSNPGKPSWNTKPSRGPVAQMNMVSAIKPQNESVESAGTASSGSFPLAVEARAPETEAEQSEDLGIESTNVTAEGSVSLRSPSKELQGPSPVSKTQPGDIDFTAPSTSTEPSCRGRPDASLVPSDVAMHEPFRSSAVLQVTQTDLQKEISINKRSSSENSTTHQFGDIDMSDAQTLVDEVSGSHGMSQISSSSLSPSPEGPPREQEGHRHVSEQAKLSNCGNRAESHTLDERHENPAGLPNDLSAPSDSAKSKVNDNQDMDPEKLLKALAKHHENQKQQAAQLDARERDRETHLHNLELLCQALSQQLQENEDQMALQGDELAKYRQLIPSWQARFEKLSKLVKGLANDHDRLRDSGHAIHKEQRDLVTQTQVVRKVLDDTKAALHNHRLQQQKLVSAARSDAKLQEQALNSKNLDLLKASTNLEAEQSRNASLQQVLDKSTSYHEGLSARLEQHETAIGSRITGMCAALESAVGKTSFAGHENLMAKLQECLTLLKEPRAAVPDNSDEIHNLGLAIKTNTDRLSHLTATCERSTETTAQLETKLVSQYQAHFQKALSSIETGQVSQEQINNLREIKATIGERLRAAETSVIDSRLKIATFENQEQLHLQKIAALEAEIHTVRNQTHESPLLALRLHDAEKQCATLREQLVKYNNALDASKTDIAAKGKESSELHDLLEATKADLEEQRAKFVRMSEEKANVEAQAVVTANAIRADLSRVCQNEISRMTNHLLNEIKSLQLKVSVTEREIVTGKDKMEQLHADKSAALENVVRLEKTIRDLQEETSTSRGTISQLEQYLEEGRREKLTKDEELREAQDELRCLRAARLADNEAAQRLSTAEAARIRLEDEISGIRESFEQTKGLLAAADSRSRTQEAQMNELTLKLATANKVNATAASSPVRSSGRCQSSERQPVVVEDSQDRAPKPRRGILKSKAIIEDSQDKGAQIPQQGRQLSSDELSRGESLPRMPKEVRDLLLRSSSPLTDIQRTSSPVMDGGAMFPPSPGDGQGNKGSGLSARKRGDALSHGNTMHRESSVGGDLWSYETSTTSTRVRAVSASLHGMSASASSHFPPRRVIEPSKATHSLSQSSGTVTQDSQSNRQSHHTREDHGMKRSHPGSKPGAASSEGQSKRRRLSTEKEKFPGQTSPVKSTSSRRGTLRRSKDKFSERFQKELE
ncbi:MAG: hypothetical protein Q9185_004577 [Variospora sp. 1 TL-2023]